MKGILYIGSTSGLLGYNLNSEEFLNFSSDDVKPWIQSLESSGEDQLWISTLEGLFTFDVKKKKFNHYEKEDGLNDNTFQLNASCSDENGRLYFCSRTGVMIIQPDDIKINESPPNTYVTDIKVIGADGTRMINMLDKQNLELQHNDHHVTINFTGLSYNRPEKNQYAYKLDGFDEDWNYTNALNLTAVYTNLDPDDYTLSLIHI